MGLKMAFTVSTKLQLAVYLETNYLLLSEETPDKDTVGKKSSTLHRMMKSYPLMGTDLGLG